ncbi:LuxR C-terminal-related transcriptional regulator [Salipiger mangrovisoli]|uniref:Response regulator transcription factor n=1 Tax=Salipiger mangrovisoli TaxID=2865933 RepID=A0ABR9X3P2_9RHOB|nr:response regulator transcription factor [Salipiger mangrovisoli]
MSISNSSEPILYIVDEMPLTRAQLSQFLSGFARLHGLRIEEVSASNTDDIFPQAQGGMCVINTGASTSTSIWFAIVQKLSQTARLGPVVVFCEMASAEFVRGALEAGARGVVPAATDPAVALKSLDLTLHGGIFVPPSVLDLLHSSEPSREPDDAPPSRPEQLPDLSGGSSGEHGAAPRPTAAPQSRRADTFLKEIDATDIGAGAEEPDLGELTPRQLAVLDNLGQARSNKEIARALDTTEATVKLHVRQVMRKLGAKNRTEAALIAARRSQAKLAEHAPGDRPPVAARQRPETPALPDRVDLVAAVTREDAHRVPSGFFPGSRKPEFNKRAVEHLRRMEKSASVHFSGQPPEPGRLS